MLPVAKKRETVSLIPVGNTKEKSSCFTRMIWFPSMVHLCTYESSQSDQIGRILADCLLWVVFSKITEVATFFGYFFHGYDYAIILSKMYMATFWAIVLTSSSGHPESSPPGYICVPTYA
jgi:hypothetical protein